MKLAGRIAQVCFFIIIVYGIGNGFTRPTEFETVIGYASMYIIDGIEIIMWISVAIYVIFLIRRKYIDLMRMTQQWYQKLPTETQEWLRP